MLHMTTTTFFSYTVGSSQIQGVSFNDGR